ncbi:MAG: hypothetical protein JWN88_2366 [Frankiales bacterium]|jgi:hypothetical protein|nr:hypothetical protein [Frankiales bacterium]
MTSRTPAVPGMPLQVLGGEGLVLLAVSPTASVSARHDTGVPAQAGDDREAATAAALLGGTR